MPTGYTEKVETGEISDLATFAMTCARAFGALVSMRDDSLNATIPLGLVPSNYHLKRIIELNEELERLYNLTEEQIEFQYATDVTETAAINLKRCQEKQLIRTRYEDMLKQVQEWVPPSDEHIDLKSFMLQQLNDSIKFDCTFYEEQEPPERSVWFNNLIQKNN